MSDILYVDDRGYYRYKDTDKLIHRDIAYKQIYNPTIHKKKFSDYVVHHIDGNKRNNKVSNLELIDRKEHRKIHGYGNVFDKFVDWLDGE